MLARLTPLLPLANGRSYSSESGFDYNRVFKTTPVFSLQTNKLANKPTAVVIRRCLSLYLQVLLESDGQDLSHDDGGSSSFPL